VRWNPALRHELSKVAYEIEQTAENCNLTITHEVENAPLTVGTVKDDDHNPVESDALPETGEPVGVVEIARALVEIRHSRSMLTRHRDAGPVAD
jgi:hypothetical protein